MKNIVKNDETTGVNRAGSGRGLLWKGAIKYTLEHPLIGGGMECLYQYYLDNGITYNDCPHNVILQISSFIGIPGALVYLTFIGYLGLSLLNKLKKDNVKIMIYVSAMCYFISSLFGNSMYYTSPYFMILLGFLISMMFNYKKIS